MPITGATIVRLAEIGQQKTTELWEEWLAELRKELLPTAFDTVDADSNIAAADRELDVGRGRGYDEPWSFERIKPITGDWEETSRIDSGETYGWPDGSIDSYEPYLVFVGTGDVTGATLALGFKSSGEIVGFVLGAGGGSKRGLTVFWPTDDDTDEVISMIRGGGKKGRAGFKSNETLPGAYQGFRVEMLPDRVAGKWNVRGVVANSDDHKTMLNHTALQAKLRGLI
jgi:hypothetical protein